MHSPQNFNLIGRVSHFFTVNRSLSLLLLSAILLFGLFSFLLTPKQYNPEIVRPAFLVSLGYEGATVEEASDRVVYELVEKVRSVPGVDDVYTEVRDGASIDTTVIFEVGYDATKAKIDLLAQIEQHKYVRTGLTGDPRVVEINPETIPVLQVVFGADGLSVSELREQVVRIAHKLGSVNDVSEVSVHGGYTESLVVEIDPQKLSVAGVTLDSVISVLKSSQKRVVETGIENDTYKIETVFDARVADAQDIGALRIKEEVRLRDVALVYKGVTGNRTYVHHHTSELEGEVVILAVSKIEGSSAPVVTGAVLEQIAFLTSQPEFSALSYEVVSDDGATASSEIYGLTKNLLTSIVIVALVLMLFLSTRAAAVVLVAIPVTLLIVFGLGYLFDQTINRITLFALILSLGLLVDSAIVVVENIYAHVRTWGKDSLSHSREAVIARAVHEIGIGLMLSTVTSVIVFLPMGYITGMMGPYMGPIAFFVPVALIVSLFVAVTITPFIAGYMITADDTRNVVQVWFSNKMDHVTAVYTRILRSILESRRRQKTLLLSALLIFLISLVLPLFGFVHFQMLPKADRDQFYIYVDLPVEMSVTATEHFSKKVIDVLLVDSDVVSVQSYVGRAPIVDFNGMFKGSQNRTHTNQSTMRVNLVKADQRHRSSTEIVHDLRERMHETLTEQGSFVRFMEDPPGPPVRATFVATISAPEGKIRDESIDSLYATFADISGLVDLYTSEEESVGRTIYRFDHEAAAVFSVSPESAATALRLLSSPLEVTEYVAGNSVEFSPVLLTVNTGKGAGSEDSTSLMVPTADGGLVPLHAVAVSDTKLRPSRINFEDSEKITYITADVEGRSVVYVVIDVVRDLIRGSADGLDVRSWGLFGMELVHETTNSIVSIEWGGEWKMTLENFRDLGIAMGVALLLVYGVLVAQYNRFSTPAYILVTIPLGLVGILWGFLLLDRMFGIYLTATALIGFIALIGLVVNNAIIYLEYVTQMQDAGRSYKESLLAAGQARIRPIMLTSLTTVLGSLTIASDPVWSGLAWAIVFGLSLSTILTLVIYPTLLMYFTSDKS